MSENQGSDSFNTKIPDSLIVKDRLTNGQRSVTNRSVYINLPAEKKSGKQLSDLVLEESGMITS